LAIVKLAKWGLHDRDFGINSVIAECWRWAASVTIQAQGADIMHSFYSALLYWACLAFGVSRERLRRSCAWRGAVTHESFGH